MLHIWNDFIKTGTQRKLLKIRGSPRKKVCRTEEGKHSEHTFESSDSLDAGPDFDIERVDNSEESLQILNNSELQIKVEQLEQEKGELLNDISNLNTQLMVAKQQDNKIIKHILSTDKMCCHYTGFNTSMCHILFKFLDPGINGCNIVLYANQAVKEGSGRGRKRALSPFDSFILCLTIDLE